MEFDKNEIIQKNDHLRAANIFFLKIREMREIILLGNKTHLKAVIIVIEWHCSGIGRQLISQKSRSPKPDSRTHMCIPCAFVVFWYMIKILFLIIRERLDS